MRKLSHTGAEIRFLADENLPRKTIEFVESLGFDVSEISKIKGAGLEDIEIVDYAIQNNRIVLTLDLDYGKIYYFSRRGKFGVVILRIFPQTSENINHVLKKFLEPETLTKIPDKSLVVVEEKGYRIFK